MADTPELATKCSDCRGLGYTSEPGDDNPSYPRCPRCDGTGWRRVPDGAVERMLPILREIERSGRLGLMEPESLRRFGHSALVAAVGGEGL